MQCWSRFVSAWAMEWEISWKPTQKINNKTKPNNSKTVWMYACVIIYTGVLPHHLEKEFCKIAKLTNAHRPSLFPHLVYCNSTAMIQHEVQNPESWLAKMCDSWVRQVQRNPVFLSPDLVFRISSCEFFVNRLSLLPWACEQLGQTLWKELWEAQLIASR